MKLKLKLVLFFIFIVSFAAYANAGPAEQGYTIIVDRQSADALSKMIRDEGQSCGTASAAILANLKTKTYVTMCNGYDNNYTVQLHSDYYTVRDYDHDEMFGASP